MDLAEYLKEQCEEERATKYYGKLKEFGVDTVEDLEALTEGDFDSLQVCVEDRTRLLGWRPRDPVAVLSRDVIGKGLVCWFGGGTFVLTLFYSFWRVWQHRGCGSALTSIARVEGSD